MITIQIGTRTFKAPTTWAECNRTQAEALAVFIGYQLPNSPITNHQSPSLTRDLQEHLICTWLRCDTRFWSKVTMQPHEFFYLLKQTAWILDPKTELTLSFNLIELHGKKYYLPEPAYKTATALEIAWANVAWLQFTQHATACHPESGDSPDEGPQQETALNVLLSIILRPIRPDIDQCQHDARWNGDTRIPLANHICEAIELELASLPLPIKGLVLRYFESMNASFIEEFDELFNPATSGESTAIAPKYPEGFGWEATLRRIAKEGTFGNYEQVCQTNGRQIWLWEYQKHLETEAEIANMKLQEEKNKK